MKKSPFNSGLVLAALLAWPIFALSQAVQQNLMLIVNGHTGGVSIVQLNGRSYVEIEALARVASGSLSFKGNQITLTFPAAVASTVPALSPTIEPTNQGFSREFLRASIEEMSAIREWRGVLTNAVEHGYPISEDWLTIYRNQAAKNLTLASVAALTDSDRGALGLLANEFNNMQRLNNSILDSHKSMHYVSPTTFADDPLDQTIMDCAHALASIVAGGQFQDVTSCH